MTNTQQNTETAFSVGDLVEVVKSPAICNDLWGKLGNVKEIGRYLMNGEPIGETKIVVEFRDSTRNGHPDMPVFQCPPQYLKRIR